MKIVRSEIPFIIIGHVMLGLIIGVAFFSSLPQ